MFLFRVLKRDLVLAKMGTDRLLWSVPDFRSSASRDLALTNDFRTVALYHSPLTTAPIIPHWFSLNEDNVVDMYVDNVSIPHWFSLNRKNSASHK